jgi:hypothetical protein
MHSLYSPNKSIILLKHILYWKNGDILNKMIKNIKYYYFQEIIYELLIYNDEDNNLNMNGGLDKKKINIIVSLMNNLKYGIDGIKEIICDYIINCKNEELLINENTLNKCFGDFLFNRSLSADFSQTAHLVREVYAVAVTTVFVDVYEAISFVYSVCAPIHFFLCTKKHRKAFIYSVSSAIVSFSFAVCSVYHSQDTVG